MRDTSGKGRKETGSFSGRNRSLRLRKLLNMEKIGSEKAWVKVISLS